MAIDLFHRAQFLMQRRGGQLDAVDFAQFAGISVQEANQVLSGIYPQSGPGQYQDPSVSLSRSAFPHVRGLLNQQNALMNQYIPVGGGGGSMTSTTTYTSSKPKKPKFKVGDMVKVKAAGYHNFSDGTIGKVVSVLGDDYNIQTEDSDGDPFTQVIHPEDLVAAPTNSKKTVSFDSVVLPADKKEEIRAAIAQVKHSDKIFIEWGFSEVFEKGTAISLLFWGIPGTGKTLMAQAIADEQGADLKLYSTADIESMEPGGAERMIRMIFQEAAKKAKSGKPRVILFDECDSLLMDRNEVGPILGAQVNALLTEIERYDGIVIFTTNRLGKLDPALERRITAKVEFEFPDAEAREAIWKRMVPKKAPLHKDVNFKKLAEYPIAGGNIKNAVLNAARAAAHKGEKKITMSHFITAIEREQKSQDAFQSEYQKQTHPRLVRGGDGMSMGMNKTMGISKTMNIGKMLANGRNEDE